jgi:hypothetical protein
MFLASIKDETMMKRLLVLIACLGLGTHLSGCTSKDSKQDSEVTSDYDSSELEKVEGSSEIAADGAVSSDNQLPESALADPQAPAGTNDLAVDPATPPTDAAPVPAETAVTDTTASTATDIMPPAPADTNTTVVDSAPSASSMDTSSEAPKKVSAPLQKVAAAPWKSGKIWINAIYFARPNDTLEGISQMIYGADKMDMLKKANPTYNSRDVKPGDKVYYNSPQRPEDSTKVATYYEDNGMQPEIYTAKAGDNIRKVSKDLVGYPNGWKEVWASNEVDSKGEIPEGTQLKYWKGGAAAAASVAAVGNTPSSAPAAHNEMAQPNGAGEVAANAPPPVQEMAPPPPPAQAQNSMPPPPAGNELPPPPPPPPDMAQNEAALPPPPPPPQEMAPPPPPPPPAAVAKEHHRGDTVAAEGSAPLGMDSDTTMALAAVGLAAAGLAVLIVVRKKRRQKEMDHVMNDTQVGT